MSRTESAQDSSMEEILASIRRIISEDAAPAKLQPVSAAKPIAPVHQPWMFTGMKPGIAGVQQVRQPEPPPVFTQVTDDSPVDDDEILDLGSNYAAVTRSPLPAAAQTGPASAPQKPESVAEVLLAPSSQVWANPPLPAAPEPVLPQSTEATAEAAAPSADTLGSEDAGATAGPENSASPAWTNPETAQFAEPAISSFSGNVEQIESAFESPKVQAEQAALPFAVAEAAVVEEPMAEVQAEAPAAAEVAIPTVSAFVERASDQVAANSMPIASTPVPRTLEDAVADMLKPMLREWLDANMPRIIEKAMAKPGI